MQSQGLGAVLVSRHVVSSNALAQFVYFDLSNTAFDEALGSAALLTNAAPFTQRVLLSSETADSEGASAEGGGGSAGAGAGAGGGGSASAADGSTAPEEPEGKLSASGALDFVILLSDSPAIVGARTSVADLADGSFDVGTPVWMVSHPLGKRAYVSRGFITEWDPERAFFNHNIPSFPGSSGKGGGVSCVTRVHADADCRSVLWVLPPRHRAPPASRVGIWENRFS
jgi:hypothetical protein